MLDFVTIWFLIGAILVLVLLLGIAVIISRIVQQKKVRVGKAKVSGKRVSVNEELFMKGKDN